MKIKNFYNVIEHELADLYSAEQQLLEALQKLSKLALNQELKESIDAHHAETKEHISRLKEAAKVCEFELEEVTCKGIQGLIKESDETLNEIDEGVILDTVIIESAQKTEHYEIASYNSLITHLEEAGFDEAAKILKETLDEEKAADKKLGSVAGPIHKEAVKLVI